MRIEGTLTKWNDDRGFGFITPTGGGPDVFVHVSMFPRGTARPTIGEKLTFEIERDSNGKLRATNLFCPERSTAMPGRRPGLLKPAWHYRKARAGVVSRLVTLLGLVGLVAYGYAEYSRRAMPWASDADKRDLQAPSHDYHCDGRTHCSQMTSCKEATFFLRNCPNVQMDGNSDGVPCEQQWCGDD